MLQMMARENMDEWRTSAVVEQEDRPCGGRSVCGRQDHAAGDPEGCQKAVIRHAPSYVQGEDSSDAQEYPYTAAAIAEFLGWADPKIHMTLSALELIKQEVLKEGHFEGLTTKQAEALTTETRKTKRTYDTAAKTRPGEKAKRKTEDRGKREAAKVAEHVAKLQTGEIGYKQVSQEADKFRAKPGGKAPRRPRPLRISSSHTLTDS